MHSATCPSSFDSTDLPDKVVKAELGRPAARARRILLADDQEYMLQHVRPSLYRNGFEVDVALSGAVALALIEEHSYDAILVDVGMPSMSGEQLCRAVHERLGAATPPILVLGDVTGVSATSGETPSSWIDSLPATERVDTPMSLRFLVARLNELFGEYEQHQDL